MGFDKRKNIILAQLEQQPFLFFSDLEHLLDVSPTTIRRDLTALEKEGSIIRFHGGIKKDKGVAEMSMNKKQTIHADRKKLIAKTAAEKIKPNSLIFIGSGSTTFAMLNYIHDTSITVITNGIPHAELLNKKNIRTFLLCGFIKERTRSTAGEQTVKMIHSYVFDSAFLGANGVGSQLELLSADEYEHNIKNAAIQASNYSYILADSSKFQATAMFNIPLQERPNIFIITEDYGGSCSQNIIIAH